jgi:hypothetical protein
MSPFFLLAASILLVVFTLQAYAEDSPYLTSLLDSARQQQLDMDPYWLTLVHYKRGPFGIRSLIDDPKFFLSPKGKYDPEAELEATIRAFFESTDDETEHAVCRFIARYTWLKEKLNIDPRQLPVPECRRFAALMEQIKPESVSMIFPTAHMNSPASMFGHTLLSVETTSKSKLLSHAINYSAVTKETFGPLFALKGLFGFYPGYYSILPYYAKLQEYGDIDDRDIWEYSLNLNEEEVRRLLMHVYELNAIYSDYYFFDENCSYELFFLIDAARPGLDLTDQTAPWVIPLDTVRVARKNGLITGTAYRPSKSTRVKYIASLLPEEGRKKALAIADGDLDPETLSTQEDIPKEEKIRICDLAVEYLQYQHAKEKLTRKEYLGRFLKTLRARSALGGAGESQYRIPSPAPPDEGHRSNRVSLGLGVKRGDLFQEVAWRPAYHDLLDSDRGYRKGAQIIFSSVALRYYPSQESLQLDNFDFIDIVSLTPRDDFFHPISWKIKTGLERRILADGDDHLIYRLNPGGGFAYQNRLLGLCYVMVETDLNLARPLEHNYAAGIGGSAGLIKPLADFWKLHVFVTDIYYGLGDTTNTIEAKVLQNFAITTNTSLGVSLSANRSHGSDETEAKVTFHLFF